MTPGVIYGVTGLLLFGLGLHALFTRPHLVHKVVAGNVTASGVFLVLLYSPEGGTPDPVPQALVLTGIVVSVAATAYTAALIDRLARAGGRTRLPDGDGR